MLDQPILPVMRVRPGPVLPVADMVVGQTPEAAAALLPRLFNLCRVAQGIAARAAFGLPLEDDWHAALRREIIKEHVLKLCLKWPGMLSLPQLALPAEWRSDDDALRRGLIGEGPLPETYDGFRAFVCGDAPIAPLLRAIRALFADGEGARAALALASPANSFDGAQRENSVPARHATHPVLRGIEAREGRGPFWTAAGVLYDLDACLMGTLPAPVVTRDAAFVPAARGLYALQARVTDGRVTAFRRITPTDHLLAPGGMLEQSLARLTPERAGTLAPLLLSILDPCFPVALERDSQGVPGHA